MKKIAIFDLDGTLTYRDNFKSFMLKILIKSPKKWIFIPYLLLSFLRYFLFKDYIMRSKLKAIYTRIILKNQKKDFIEYEAKQYVDTMKNSLNQDVFDYFKEFKKFKYTTILATGSLDVYTKYFVKKIGLNFYVATELEIRNCQFTGNIINSNCIGSKKFHKINDLLKVNNLTWSNATFFSDDISDLLCFKSAKKSFFINPKKSDLEKLNHNKVIYKKLVLR
tara:strand:+ start:184 stop:849 length:666 start_codon:yes stop_codon:yes gene_type:complete